MDRLLAISKLENFFEYEAAVFSIQASTDTSLFDAALELLLSELPDERCTAIEVIAQFGSISAERRWEVLQHQLLSERDPGVVATIVSSLKFTAPSPRVHAEVLAKLLGSPETEILAEILKEFPRELGYSIVDQVVGLSAHEDDDVSFWACDMLADVGSGDSEEIRCALLRRIERSPGCEEPYVGLAIRKDVRLIPLLTERLQSYAVRPSLLKAVEVWPQESYIAALDSQIRWWQDLIASAEICISLCRQDHAQE